MKVFGQRVNKPLNQAYDASDGASRAAYVPLPVLWDEAFEDVFESSL
jgi:hypothetical protein